MLLDQIKDVSFLYFTVLSFTIPLYAMPLVTSYKHALYTTNKTYTLI
jgi:hypothetical protein